MKKPLFIAIVYLVFGLLWIYFSDRLVLSLWGSNAESLTRIQNMKGYFFVVLSALLIAFLIKLFYARTYRQLRKMDQLLSGSSMGILRVNPQGYIIDVSYNLSGIVGYNKGDLDKKPFHYLLAEAEKPKAESILEDLRKGNIHAFKELDLMHKSGEEIPVRLTCTEETLGGMDNELTMLVKNLALERKSEIERLKSLELFENIFKHVPILMTIYDPEVKQVRVNEEFEEILGWKNEEVAQIDIMKEIYPDESVRKTAEEWMGKHDAGWKELPLVTKDGEERIQEWSNIHLSDQTSVGIGVDITDLKKKEQELRYNEELFEGIFNTAQVGLCLTDRDGYFKMVNEEYCRLYGYEASELIGHQITKILPEETHAEALEVSRKIVDGEIINPSRNWQVIDKYGELLDILINISVLKVEGENLQLTSVMDITEQKTIQRKLESSRVRLKTAQKIAKIGYWELDLQTNNLFWEEEVYKIWGVSPDEFKVSFESFYNSIHPDDRPTFDMISEKALAGEIDLNYEHRIILPDKTVKWMLEKGWLVRNDQGEAVKFQGVVQDITGRKEREQQLRLQSKLLGAVGQGVIATDNEGKIIYWNKAAEEIYQWKEEEVIGKSITDVTTTDQTRDQAMEIMEKLTKGQSWSGEFLAKQRNGTEIPILVTNTPVFDDNESLVAIIGVSIDITERKRKEEELKSLNQRLSAITNNLPGAVFQYKRNIDGSDELLYLSEGSKLLWGMDPEDAMKNNQLVWQQIHPDDIDQMQSEIGESAESLSDWNAEWRNVKPDGSIRWHQGLGTPREVEDGVIWDSIILDVTNRKKAELELKEREEYLRILMDNASDAILASDTKGRILFFNDRLTEWTGIDGNDLPMEEWPDKYGLFHVSGSRKLKPEELSVAKVLKDGEVKNYEYMIKGKNGDIRIVEINGSSIHDSEGEGIGAMVVIRDITERLNQEEKNTNDILEALEKERAEIAREIHDSLTQKLSISSMNLKNLAHDVPKIAKEVKYSNALRFLRESINESRSISHHIMPPGIKDFGLIAAIEDMVETLNVIDDLNVNFSYNNDERLSEELELNIYRVVQEAMSNVQNHSKAKNVDIVATISRSKLYLSVTDDGIGFDLESNRNRGKRGIGLRTMRSRILSLRGKFEINSKPNNGTTIVIEVPIKVEQDG